MNRLSLAVVIRELSHYWKANPHGPLYSLPSLAAQHLMDGFPLEILDGDANLLAEEWIVQMLAALQERLEQLMPDKPVTVKIVSVLGAQSSGKRCDILYFDIIHIMCLSIARLQQEIGR